MGLNCVAGTTEYDEDEDEGIGLVLYTNSEGQLIVWKMSDGTKQGTAVPLTTDYQSMLKSEFENKTGITIGYIIIHPYTEETIDIESSITINSGDTPTQNTLVAIANNSSGSPVYCGIVVGKQLNFLSTNAYRNRTLSVGYPNGILYSKEGDSIVEGQFVNNIIPQLQRIGIEVETFGYDYNWDNLEVNEQIPNWDEYTYVPW